MKKLMPLEKFVDKINDAIYEAEGKTISKSGCWASLDIDKNGSQYITVSCANGEDLEPVQKIVETLMKVFYKDKMDFIFDN